MDNRIILKVKAGSHLYGLNTPASDEDFIGVYLSKPEEIFGLQRSEIIDESIISKQENGKNDKDAVDCKYYELRRFCNLALNANPTILELFFANPENIEICDEYGLQLICNRNLFLSTKIKHSYLGYAHDQMKASHVKSENLVKLTEAVEVLSKIDNPKQKKIFDLININGSEVSVQEEFKSFLSIDARFPDYVIIADVKFNNKKIKDVINKINNRLSRASNRADGMLKNGLDYKFVSHTVRLIKEGEELLKTGHLNFPLKERDLLMQIKLGQIPPTEVMDLIGDLEKTKEDWSQYNLLPKTSDFKAVNQLVIDIYKEYLGVN